MGDRGRDTAILPLRVFQGKNTDIHISIMLRRGDDSRLTAITLSVALQVVQEYERAVIFRLGRLLADGSRGPGTVMPLSSSRCCCCRSVGRGRSVSDSLPPSLFLPPCKNVLPKQQRRQ